jgi:hypothetical protein
VRAGGSTRGCARAAGGEGGGRGGVNCTIRGAFCSPSSSERERRTCGNVQSVARCTSTESARAIQILRRGSI